MISYPREIRNYITPEGKIPFAEWLNSLRDIGDKSTQNKDIVTAKKYWQEYKMQKND